MTIKIKTKINQHVVFFKTVKVYITGKIRFEQILIYGLCGIFILRATNVFINTLKYKDSFVMTLL